MNWNEIENAFNKAAEEKSRWEEPDDKSDKSDKSESEASGNNNIIFINSFYKKLTSENLKTLFRR